MSIEETLIRTAKPVRKGIKPITVIGMSNGGRDKCPASLLQRILSADILAGSGRQLSHFPDFTGTVLTLGVNPMPVFMRLEQAQKAGFRCVVLASGDPLHYGIGHMIQKSFLPGKLEIFPTLSIFHSILNRLGDVWIDAEPTFMSVHGQDPGQLIMRSHDADAVIILTDMECGPHTLANRFIASGLPLETICLICENPGTGNERVHRLSLTEARKQRFSPLALFVIWNQPPL